MQELFPLYMASIYPDAYLFPLLFATVIMLPVVFLIFCNVDLSRKARVNVQEIVEGQFQMGGRKIVMQIRNHSCPVCQTHLKSLGKHRQHSIVECSNQHRFIQTFNAATLVKEIA